MPIGQSRPRVLLLGDSIRMSYQPLVARELSDLADVIGPQENCQFSLYTLSALTRWLTEFGPPAVVHWNNGLHDCGHNPNRRPVQIPLDDYRANIEFIYHQLLETGAKVIWATTTPAHPRRPFLADQWSWRNEEIGQYNEAAGEVMRRYGVPVNDLHAAIASDPDRYLDADLLHLSDAGRQACAAAAAAIIRQQLGK